MNSENEVHFRILRAIEMNPEISQRTLSSQLGISKGKAHYLIAALVDKGLLKIGHFSRHGGKLAKVVYLLTLEGIRNRVELTREYLARKETEYEALHREIEALKRIEQRECDFESESGPAGRGSTS